MDVTVYYLGFKVHSAQGDLCASLPCPIFPGVMQFNMSFTMSSYAPPGVYTLKLIASQSPLNPLLQESMQENHHRSERRRTSSYLEKVGFFLRTPIQWSRLSQMGFKRNADASACNEAHELFCVEFQFSPQ
ncbi:hypothetical protein CEUSTIGMA_g2216.t1 [Chlamydomonas eustigma]|uniref:MD-2-related lipid-recognition domain-containing protein n=1 Tax=Chlamydomonas eustigma TaxID=1157962 RepID=A0A250WVN5_9CHLO|nr:hypothetical protein CEUSTIGMA_g2216.t1 [Chlamydomonas eustigma]|eukprot:GAX74769.1 hypothetical protein CEUSTIGMA_g2216.t1 [Chlamydomonas eustigma]